MPTIPHITKRGIKQALFIDYLKKELL